MKKPIIKLLTSIFLMLIVCIQFAFAQIITSCYTVASGGNTTIVIKDGSLYRITIKSCLQSYTARMGSYLIYGLNISDSKTSGKPQVLQIDGTASIDWTFSYTLSGSYDANMKITSSGWGDQGLLIIVEELKCSN